MKGRLILLLAALLIAQPAGTRRALAQTQVSDKAISFEQIITICRTAMLERLHGKSPTASGAMFQALPPAARDVAIVTCAAYSQGQVDWMSLLNAGLKPAQKI